MKLIPLTQGKFAMVDDEDFEWLNQWKWYAWRAGPDYTWYSRRSTFDVGTKVRGCVYMHRAIAAQVGFSKVDHEDGNGLNNQRDNLRPCSNASNCRNRGVGKNNSSGFKGVHWEKRRKRWMVNIMINYKNKFLGYFSDKLDAIKAYNTAALKYHGEFANLNDLSKYENT